MFLFSRNKLMKNRARFIIGAVQEMHDFTTISINDTMNYKFLLGKVDIALFFSYFKLLN